MTTSGKEHSLKATTGLVHSHEHKQTLKSLLFGVVIGFFFGFALEKSKVFVPSIIRTQMHFQTFTMIKMFLSGFFFVFYFILFFIFYFYFLFFVRNKQLHREACL
jgi:hypothetical protein